MRTFTSSIVLPVAFSVMVTSSAAAQDRHLVDPATLAAAVTDHAAAQDADRAAIREALGRADVRDVASKAGIDLARASAAAETLRGPDLARAAELARQVNGSLVGGANSVTLSTTTIIIILLVVILLVVAVK